MTEQDGARRELLAVLELLLGDGSKRPEPAQLEALYNAALAAREYLLAEQQASEACEACGGVDCPACDWTGRKGGNQGIASPVVLECRWTLDGPWNRVGGLYLDDLEHAKREAASAMADKNAQRFPVEWRALKVGREETELDRWKTAYAPIKVRPNPAKRAHKRARKGR